MDQDWQQLSEQILTDIKEWRRSIPEAARRCKRATYRFSKRTERARSRLPYRELGDENRTQWAVGDDHRAGWQPLV